MPPLPSYLLYDKDNRFICPIAEHDEATVTWKLTETGTGTISIPGEPTEDVFNAVMNVHETTTLVDVRGVEGRRWTGRVHNGEYVDEGEGPSLEITLVNDRVWLDAMLALVNPTGSMTQQGGAENDTRTGPTETVIKEYIRAAAVRLGVPMIVVPSPDVDTSPVVTLNARMTNLKELIEDSLKAAGLGVDVTMHRTGMPLPPELQGYEPADGTLVLDFIRPRATPRLLWDQQQLTRFSVSSTTPSAYRAITGGEGQGVARVFTEFIDAELRDKVGLYGLPELYVDNDTTSGNEAAYVAPGTASPATKAALAKAAGGLAVKFEVEDARPWYVGTDWWLADYANARIGGQIFSAQVTEVELSENADGGVTYKPTIGDPLPSRPEFLAEAVTRLVADIRRRQARR